MHGIYLRHSLKQASQLYAGLLSFADPSLSCSYLDSKHTVASYTCLFLLFTQHLDVTSSEISQMVGFNLPEQQWDLRRLTPVTRALCWLEVQLESVREIGSGLEGSLSAKVVKLAIEAMGKLTKKLLLLYSH